MDTAALQSKLELQLSMLGFDLVLLEPAGDVIRVFVEHLDHAAPVTLDDCVAVNDGLAAWLDVEFPDLRYHFGIEVSSPGLERPLSKPEHFCRFRGRLCRVQTRLPVDGQKRFKGWIGGIAGSAVTIEEDGRLVSIPLDAIQRARLAPFDEGATPGPKFAEAAAMQVPMAADGRAGAEKSADKEA